MICDLLSRFNHSNFIIFNLLSIFFSSVGLFFRGAVTFSLLFCCHWVSLMPTELWELFIEINCRRFNPNFGSFMSYYWIIFFFLRLIRSDKIPRFVRQRFTIKSFYFFSFFPLSGIWIESSNRKCDFKLSFENKLLTISARTWRKTFRFVWYAGR